MASKLTTRIASHEIVPKQIELIIREFVEDLREHYGSEQAWHDAAVLARKEWRGEQEFLRYFSDQLRQLFSNINGMLQCEDGDIPLQVCRMSIDNELKASGYYHPDDNMVE